MTPWTLGLRNGRASLMDVASRMLIMNVRIFDRTAQRLREIERIVRRRYGVVPDTDDADIILKQVACCQLNMQWKNVNRRWNGTPYRHPKGTPLNGGFCR